MRRSRQVIWAILVILVGLVAWLRGTPQRGVTWAEDQPPGKKAGAQEKGATGEPAAKPAPQFMRVVKDDDGEPTSLETAVVRYTADPQKYAGVQVDLIGAIHVGDRAYYDQLNKLFKEYDAVLYELVAPEGTRIPKEGRPSGNLHPVGALQNGLKSLLNLEHQLECVDYTVDNLVHADMSPDEFAQRMKDRNEGWLQMALRMMGQSAAVQGRNAQTGGDAKLLFALFAKDRPLKLKRLMAEQLSNSETALVALDGPDGGSTIISERNKKALSVFARQVDEGKKKIAIFYGAGHLADFEKRLVGEMGYRRGDERWLTAWSMTAPSR